MAKKSYLEIQEEVIKKYNIDICNGDKCENDWQRTHAHVRERRVCKWKKANSVQSTFTLLHEIGHIETTKSKMRRVEAEYHATVWAIKKCEEYGIEIPEATIKSYQEYIDEELARGKRRGGKGYEDSYQLVVEKKAKELEPMSVTEKPAETKKQAGRKPRTKTEMLCGAVRKEILEVAERLIESVANGEARIKEIEGTKEDAVIRFVLILNTDETSFKEDIAISKIRESLAV